MTFELIIAVSINNVIGIDGTLPWKGELKNEMILFRDITSLRPYKNVLICGKNTYPSMKNIRDRKVIMASRDMEYRSNKRYIICGGAQVYKYYLENFDISIIHVSRIHKPYVGDTYFDIDKYLYNYTPDRIVDMDGFTYQRWIKKTRSKNIDDIYVDIVDDVLRSGDERSTRNSITLSKFWTNFSVNLDTFPLITLKSVFMRGVFEELMFFLNGESDTKKLSEKGVRIWEKNTVNTNGDMGPMYGVQWRNGQLEKCIDLLINDPTSRRIIMSSYNAADVDKGVLYPCHGIHIQFYVEGDRLSCGVTLRSSDLMCGLPFNIASYALLVYLICDTLSGYNVNYHPGILHMTLGDYHIYEEHLPNARILCTRLSQKAPTLKIKREKELMPPINYLCSYKWGDIDLDYVSSGPLRFNMIA